MINILFGLIAVLILIIAIFAFIINSKDKKIQQGQEEKENIINDLEKVEAEYNKDVLIAYTQERKKNEELRNESKKNNLDGFNASIQRMRNLEEQSTDNN